MIEREIVEREVVVPVDADELWATLTETEAVAGWFGAEVEWDLTPGGAARWRGEDGERTGLIEEVSAGRRLRFCWWPDEGDDGVSEVTYDLEPLDGGESGAAVATRLVVRERPIKLGPDPAPTASVNPASIGWSAWDNRVAGVWVRAQDRIPVRA